MNIRQKHIFDFLVLVVFVLMMPQYVAAQTAVASCTNLTTDVSVGMTDGGSNGEIFQLQSFLNKSGYLSATPNGHFGPATLAAVEIFQTLNGISATGYVGPLTRASIENKTCSSTSINTNTTANAQVQTAPVLAAQSFAITSPTTNQILTLGNNYTITWSGNAGYNYSIVLQTSNGVGAGIIASSLSNGNQYVWQIGKIISLDGTGYQRIVPGTYQIHIKVTSGQDLYSGLFTVVAPNMVLNSVVPSSVPADGNTAVVLFGSGFINPISLYIDGYYSLNNLFISPDGTVIVFSVPATISVGTHSITVQNQYGSYSNSVPLTVTAPPTN